MRTPPVCPTDHARVGRGVSPPPSRSRRDATSRARPARATGGTSCPDCESEAWFRRCLRRPVTSAAQPVVVRPCGDGRPPAYTRFTPARGHDVPPSRSGTREPRQPVSVGSAVLSIPPASTPGFRPPGCTSGFDREPRETRLRARYRSARLLGTRTVLAGHISGPTRADRCHRHVQRPTAHSWSSGMGPRVALWTTQSVAGSSWSRRPSCPRTRGCGHATLGRHRRQWWETPHPPGPGVLGATADVEQRAGQARPCRRRRRSPTA